MSKFTDGIYNFVNMLANRRSAIGQNVMYHTQLDRNSMEAAYLSGIGNKIVNIKSGYALNDTIAFEDTSAKEFYNDRLQSEVKRACRFMIAYGRGIIVMFEPGENLAEPMRANADKTRMVFRAFDGGMVTASQPDTDLTSRRYMKPRFYAVRGQQIHYSRVIDFTYIEPPEMIAGQYQYGGVSEFELIDAQMKNDGVVERASGTIVEKNATVFHKIVGYKDAIASGRESQVLAWVGACADARSIYGDGIIDSEDDIITVSQTLTNLSDVNMITLSRLAFVTGIPVSEFIGEQPKGLNSTGESDRQSLASTIENIQSEYLQRPLQELFTKLGLGKLEFKEIQSESVKQRVDSEAVVITNATNLAALGEDYSEYLRRYDIRNGSTLAEELAAAFGEVGGDEAAD